MGSTADPTKKRYTLLGADGQPYQSDLPGTLGGNRRGKIYGRLDCPAALRAIARGGYVEHRVFFLDEKTAIAAGYRPCAVCFRQRYILWKAAKKIDQSLRRDDEERNDPQKDRPRMG